MGEAGDKTFNAIRKQRQAKNQVKGPTSKERKN